MCTGVVNWVAAVVLDSVVPASAVQMVCLISWDSSDPHRLSSELLLPAVMVCASVRIFDLYMCSYPTTTYTVVVHASEQLHPYPYLTLKLSSHAANRRAGIRLPLEARVCVNGSDFFVPPSSVRIFNLPWTDGRIGWTMDGRRRRLILTGRSKIKN